MNYYDLPKRKHPRSKRYDYSTPGYYHVTICSYEKRPIFSSITERCEQYDPNVGRGLAPAVQNGASIVLTPIGKIAEEHLNIICRRFSSVRIYNYVIMPDHIHIIFRLCEDTAGASPRPTLIDVVRTYKSLITRVCNERDDRKGRILFQTSFFDTIIWNAQQLNQTNEYISLNPERYLEKKKRSKNIFIKE